MTQAKTKKKRSEYAYIMVNTTAEMKAALQKEAKRESRSVANLCRMLIQNGLDQRSTTK